MFSSDAEAQEEAPGPLGVVASGGARDIDEMVGAESGGMPSVEEEEKEVDSDHTSEPAGEEDGGESRNDGRETLVGGDRVSRVGFRRFDHGKLMLKNGYVSVCLSFCGEVSLHS